MPSRPLLIIVSLVCVAALVSSCGISSEPTPFPQLPPTLPTESPTTTHQPAASPAAISTRTPIPLPTATSTPTDTPLAAPVISTTDTGRIGVHRPFLSSRGQLAIILNGILFVESAPESGQFGEIARYASIAAWSPDGSKLLYGLSSTESYADTIDDYLVWFADTSESKSLATIVNGFPPPPYLDYGEWLGDTISWTPDSTGLFLVGPAEDDVPVFVNLAQRQAKQFSKGFSQVRIWALNSQVFLRQEHCGAPCENLSAYNYQGRQVWWLPWATAGLYAFLPDGQALINVGWVDVDKTRATVDKVDLATGQITTVWERPIESQSELNYFTYWKPSVSPAGQFITFNFGGGGLGTQPGTLYIIDQLGMSHLELENSWILDWHPQEAPTIIRAMSDGQYQLLYWPLNGQESQAIVPTTTSLIEEGQWSPDGHSLVYSTLDVNKNVTELYQWRSDFSEPQLILAHDGREAFNHLSWSPTSDSVYFALGRKFDDDQACFLCSSLWQYNTATGELVLIADSGK